MAQKIIVKLGGSRPAPPAMRRNKDATEVLFGHLMKRFDASISIEQQDAKSFVEVKVGDVVTDYRDVRVRGYLSIFRGPAEGDRDGEYTLPGAFTETLKSFRENPVMLRDHRNSTENLCGSFTTVREDEKGLYVEGVLSNAPDTASVRFKVAEGHLKTLSMGGIFHFKEDGRGIFKVDLMEGTLTPIPADPKAIISTRSFNEEELQRMKTFCRSSQCETFRD